MLYRDSHVCPPKWDVWETTEAREDARHIYARNADIAAEKYAERDDANGEYSIVGGSPIWVCVAKHGSEEISTFTVEGESVPEYTATEISKEDVEAVDAWNRDHPVGTIVKYTYRDYDRDQKATVDKQGEAATTGKAHFNEYGPVVRVNHEPFDLKLKNITEAIEKGAVSDEQ
jgi:hypothetical protein